METNGFEPPKHLLKVAIGVILVIGAIAVANFVHDLNTPNPNGALIFSVVSLFGLGIFLIFAFFVSVPVIIIWQIRTYRAKNQTPGATPKPLPRTEEDDDRDW